MFAKDNPYDNTFTESSIKTLKQEEVYLCHYETCHNVIKGIPNFILDVYNCKRLHSALGYRSPEEFENLLTYDASQEYVKAKTSFVLPEGCTPNILIYLSFGIIPNIR